MTLESHSPRDQTRPGPFSLSLCLCPFSVYLAGEVAFDLEGWERGASARLGKDTKQQPWQPQSPPFPFKPTPIQPPAWQNPEQEQRGKVTDTFRLDWLNHIEYDSLKILQLDTQDRIISSWCRGVVLPLHHSLGGARNVSNRWRSQCSFGEGPIKQSSWLNSYLAFIAFDFSQAHALISAQGCIKKQGRI